MILRLGCSVLVTAGASDNCGVGGEGAGPQICWICGCGFLASLGHHKENVRILLASIGSQSTNRMFGLVAQRNSDDEVLNVGFIGPFAN